ncbi:MAG: Rrf2 family transcriptional regulator [Verrucomicrobiota bacterium]
MRSDFTVALHILGFLTAKDGEPLSSEILAETYGTHPVVVRRILLKLSEAGMVTSQRGAGGGTVLSRDPKEITLLDVFEAVEEDMQILPRYPEEEDDLSKVIGAYINGMMENAEADLLARFKNLNLLEMDKALRPAVHEMLRDRWR